MVRHTKLGQYSGLIKKLESYSRIEYYYVAVLKKDATGKPAHAFDASHSAPQQAPPVKPHRPRYATWAEIR
jgi:hypothetical protein